MNVNVLRCLGAGSLTILLQQDCALVVLVYYAFVDAIALCLQKVLHPQNCWHRIVNTNQFGFCGASSVHLVFRQTEDGETMFHRQTSTSVATHVRANSKRAINPPLQDSSAVQTKGERHSSCPLQIFHQMHQLLPVVLVRPSHSCAEKIHHCAGVRPCSLGGKQSLGHQIVELLRLLHIKLLTVFIHHKQISGSSRSLDSAPLGAAFLSSRSRLSTKSKSCPAVVKSNVMPKYVSTFPQCTFNLPDPSLNTLSYSSRSTLMNLSLVVDWPVRMQSSTWKPQVCCFPSTSRFAMHGI